MSRHRFLVAWGLGLCAAATIVGVTSAQGLQDRDRSDSGTVRLYDGISTRGNLQDALNDAVDRALRGLAGADRMVRYRVREITGEQGGITGRNVVGVSIEVQDETSPRPGTEPPRRPEPPRPVEETPEQLADRLRESIEVELRLSDEEVDRAGTVEFELVVRNTSEQPVVVPFATGQRNDFEVWRDNRLVWRWSQGRFFTQSLGSVTLEPGRPITYRGVWNLRNNENLRVPAGRYTVRGYLVPRVEGLRLGDSATVTVTGP
jgi:hypothetical protein